MDRVAKRERWKERDLGWAAHTVKGGGKMGSQSDSRSCMDEGNAPSLRAFHGTLNCCWWHVNAA